jgi:ribosome recycling factor
MDALVIDAKQSMEKTIHALKLNLNGIRTGRATVALLDRVLVDYYGEMTAINQIASISVPEARQLLIKPYDKNDLKSINDALLKSDLGINPIVDSAVIRLNLPPLTEERRKEYAKIAKKFTEDAKVAIRSIRKDYLSMLTDDEYTEDLQKRIDQEMTKVYDEIIAQIDAVYAEKEHDILTL